MRVGEAGHAAVATDVAITDRRDPTLANAPVHTARGLDVREA